MFYIVSDLGFTLQRQEHCIQGVQHRWCRLIQAWVYDRFVKLFTM